MTKNRIKKAEVSIDEYGAAQILKIVFLQIQNKFSARGGGGGTFACSTPMMHKAAAIKSAFSAK